MYDTRFGAMFSASPSNRAKVYGLVLYSACFRFGSAAFPEQAIQCRFGHLLRL